MRFSTAIALFAGLAAAQTTECPAASIVEACLSSTQAILAGCAPNDWSCMCTSQKAVVTCYNNCPTDSRASSANSVQIQYCQAAAQQSPSSSAAVVSSSTVRTSAISSSASRASSTSSAQNGATTAVSGAGAGILALAAGVAAFM